MSSKTLLQSLLRYKTWADDNLIAGLAALVGECRRDGEEAAIATFHHAYVVDRIFASHLQGTVHGYRSLGMEMPVSVATLFDEMRASDCWYTSYLADLDEADLAQPIRFVFMDGKPGLMTREEILGHVIAHGGYHRGEVGRILTQLTGTSPRDTFTGYLHEAEPVRRSPAC